MIFGEGVHQEFKEFDLFQVSDGIEGGFFKKREIFLDHFIAKSMEGLNIYFVGVGADEL